VPDFVPKAPDDQGDARRQQEDSEQAAQGGAQDLGAQQLLAGWQQADQQVPGQAGKEQRQYQKNAQPGQEGRQAACGDAGPDGESRKQHRSD
jgi:hypothetical protein